MRTLRERSEGVAMRDSLAARRLASALILVLITLSGLPVVHAQEPDVHPRDKWGVINTRRSQAGANYHVQYTQAANERLGFTWYHDYLGDNIASQFPSANRLYGVWSVSSTRYTPEFIQDMAADARTFMGDRRVAWVIGNEPNNPDQAYVTPEQYATFYRKFHENIKLGDPDAILLGPSMFTAPGAYDWGPDGWAPGAPKIYYDAVRAAWSADPELRAYSQSVNGTNYPPLDEFSIHLYYADAQSTIAAFNRVHADISNWPEIGETKISITEIGQLGWVTQPIDDYINDLIDWSLTEDRLHRAYWFYMHEDQGPDWPNTILIDESGNVTAVGEIFRARLEPMAIPLGDVDCSRTLTLLDARRIARYAIEEATGVASCPAAAATDAMYLLVGDVDGSGTIGLLDARLVAQCAIDFANSLCPDI